MYDSIRVMLIDGIRRNLAEDVTRHVPTYALTDPKRAALEVGKLFQSIPYWFDPDEVRAVGVRTIRESLQLGTAACMDATAAVAAAALATGFPVVEICLETHPQAPAYAHVRPMVGGLVVDAYSERSLEVPSCTQIWSVRASS